MQTEQIMVREKQLKGQVVMLKPAEVLSRNGDMVKVKVVGEVTAREVRVSDTQAAAKLFGRPSVNFHQYSSLPIRCFPGSPHALGNRR